MMFTGEWLRNVGFTREEIEAIYRRPFIDGNSVELLVRGEQAFQRIFATIRSARKIICLQFYHFKNDDTGTELASILKEKVREDIPVYLLYDHLGSFGTPRSFWRDLREAGVNVRASHPFSPSAPFRYLHRDHSKVITVDGTSAFTGGLNIANQYRGFPFLRRDSWRDTGIFMRGPVALALQKEFGHAWKLWKGDELPHMPEAPAIEGGIPALPIFTRSNRGRRRMRKLLYYSINHASEEISLTTAYFVPSRRMVHTLELAVKRGVRVRLLVPGTSDVMPAHYVGRFFFSRLLRAGVEIYTYNGTMLHAKTYIFDRKWSIVGSANLDIRSIRWNDEGNVGILDNGFTRQMNDIFQNDMENSEKIRSEVWQKRPLYEKLLERFFSLFRLRL